MRAHLLLVATVAACSFDPGGVPAPDAFDDPGDDGGGVARLWRTDTVEDFAAAGAALDAARIEPWGAVGPAAWLTGGLLARASDDQLFDSIDASWDDLVAAGADADGFGVSTLVARDYGYGRPAGLSLSGSDTWTVWIEGEIRLDAGVHGWALLADDVGFIDLAPPGSDLWTRVVAGEWTSEATGSYQVAVAGWHRIRIAVAEAYFDAGLEIRLAPPGGALGPIAAERLRVRADPLTGLAWSGFDDSRLLEPIGPLLFRGDAFAFQPSDGEVTELGFSDGERLAMRWAGQVRIDVAGAPAFRLATDDGQRLWIDGVLLLDHWQDQTQDHTTAPVSLEPGWHDLVIDLTENTGSQGIALEADGEPLPYDRLRPVASRAERTAGTVRRGADIPDDGSVDLPLAAGAPAGAVASAIELGATIDHDAWQDLAIDAIAPDGSVYPLLGVGDSADTGAHTLRWTAATPDEPAAGTWALRVTDATAGDTGEVVKVAITVRYRGGEPPIAPRAVYDAPVTDLVAVVGFDAVSWSARTPPGSSVQVRLRTCEEAAGCGDQPWSAPVTESGEPPAVAGQRFAQYRIELLSDGDAVATVDWVEIAYRAAP